MRFAAFCVVICHLLPCKRWHIAKPLIVKELCGYHKVGKNGYLYNSVVTLCVGARGRRARVML